MLRLRAKTEGAWTAAVLADLDAFLQDHAANERKVSGSALTLAVHYPDRAELVAAMVELAREELDHFKQVYDLLVARGRPLGQDSPDPYMGALRRWVRRRDMKDYLLDRLLVFAIVEARGGERFALLSASLADPALRSFYARLAAAETRHHAIYLRLARLYHDAAEVEERLSDVLDAEADIVRRLPARAALH